MSCLGSLFKKMTSFFPEQHLSSGMWAVTNVSKKNYGANEQINI